MTIQDAKIVIRHNDNYYTHEHDEMFEGHYHVSLENKSFKTDRLH